MWQTEYNTAVIKGRVRPTHLSDKKIKWKRIRELSQVREMAHSLFGTSSVAKATPRAVTVSNS